MRNTIDKDSYKFLFGILIFFAIALALITALLLLNPNAANTTTLNVSKFLLSLVLGVSLWIRVDYYKLYNVKYYKLTRIPLTISACALIAVSFFSII